MCSVFVFLILATCKVSSFRHQSNMHAHGLYPARTTAYNYRNVLYPEDTTTYIYDHVVYPERSTTNTYDYGMISESAKTKLAITAKHDHGMYPEERTKTSKNDNGIHLEGETPTLINGNGVYPYWTKTSKYDPDMYLEMTTTYMYDEGQTAFVYPEGEAFADSNNCSRFIPEPIGLLNATYLQGLQDCLKGTVIRKLLCSPSMTYNISFVSNVVPYFSDVRIYFADGINNCTNRLNKFIESKNNILTNLDIYHFLTRSSTCWEYAFFTNQLCVDFKLNTHNKRLSLNVRAFPYRPIHFTLKHQACREEFIQYVYQNSLYTTSNDTFILNVDKINNFTKENSCLDIHFSCPWPVFEDMALKIPESTTVYVQLAIAVEVTLVNTFVLLIFLQKDNKTPVTILLSALAVSDSIAAIIMTVPIFTAYQIYGHRIYGHSGLYILKFPECFIYYYLFSYFSGVFHVTSVLITTLLCLQKTAALLFPMWTKQHLNNRISIICSGLMFIISISIFSQIIYVDSLLIYNFNGRCCIRNDNINHLTFPNLLIIVNACILLAFMVVALCTVYITCKLTILRRNLPWIDSPAVQKRNRISAITVVFICIIFLLSESPFIFTSFIIMLYFYNPSSMTGSEYENYSTSVIYEDLSLIIGFSLNFLVYIIMGKQIRDKLWIGAMKIARRCKCW